MSLVLNYERSTVQYFTLNNTQTYKAFTFVNFSGLNRFYNIIAGLSFNVNEDGTDRSFTLAEGNYSITTFIAALNTAINAGGSGFLQTYTFSIDTVTDKITLATSGALDFSVTYVTSYDLVGKCGWTSISAFSAADKTADNPYLINSPDLELRILTNGIENCMYQDTTGNIIIEPIWRIRIPVYSVFGGYTSYNSENFLAHTFWFKNPTAITQIKIEVRDPYNNFRLVDNNGIKFIVQFNLQAVD